MTIHNQIAYDNAIQRNIKTNARKTRMKKFYEQYDNAQQVWDWLNNCGQYQNMFKDANGILYTCDQIDNMEGNQNTTPVVNPMCEGMFSGEFGNFMIGLRNTLWEYGSLSERQVHTVSKAITRKKQWIEEAEVIRVARAAEYAKSTWVGKIKSRRMFTLKINKIISFETQFGYMFINIMSDELGNVVVGKGTKKFGFEGTIVTCKATIIKQEIHENVKQTIINRPAFIYIPV